MRSERPARERKYPIEYKNGEQIVLLNGENVNPFLRKEEVGNMASVSSANPRVREKLLDLQRKLAASMNVVMDGRDIGTTILPNAEVKIYLTASSFTRSKAPFIWSSRKKACVVTWKRSEKILKSVTVVI